MILEINHSSRLPLDVEMKMLCERTQTLQIYCLVLRYAGLMRTD